MINELELARNIGRITDIATLELLKKTIDVQIAELHDIENPKKLPMYICPYCQKRLRGPANNPKLVELNLVTHIMSSHPDKVDEFKQFSIDSFIFHEEKKHD